MSDIDFKAALNDSANRANDSALLDRVRSGCEVDNTESWAGTNFLVLSGPPELLRQLAERLGRG